MFFHDKIQQSGINITRLRTSGERSNQSANKIIIVGIGEITQLGVLLGHRDYTLKNRYDEKTAIFCEVGEMKTRGKRKIM